MMSKYFTFFAAAAVTISTAFGQVSTAPGKPALSPEQLAQRQAFRPAPMRLAGVAPSIKNGLVESYNWGGYAVTGTDFTDAKGSWVVPAVNCAASPNAAVAFWVGIDGFSDTTVEQTGVAVVCEQNAAVYFAWYEFYPSALVVISNITVTPGDTFAGEVSYSSATSEFTATLTDVSTGASYSIAQAVAGAERSSAEWIVEAPDAVTGILNLAKFGRAFFGADFTGQAGTNQATDSSVSGVIKKFGSAVQAITQIDWLLFTEQTPSALSRDGSSFFNNWIEYN
ncbi:MAG TPA: G1 family glutamic endopeptidase [Terriglobales bacterium]|nr:G1 family glutamic endopeptidase [Terriglobales bacterium]